MTILQQGQVLEVSISPTGDELVTDHSASDTTLDMADVSDFSEFGGQCTIDGVVYEYSTVDYDLATMTLLTGLEAAVAEGTPVYVYPLSNEKWAMVDISDLDDVVLARVMHTQHDRLIDGIRDENEQELVLLEMEDTDWTIRDVISKIPTLVDSDRLGMGITTNLIKDPSNFDERLRSDRRQALPARWSLPSQTDDPSLMNSWYWQTEPDASGAITTISLDTAVGIDPGKGIRCSIWVNESSDSTGFARIVAEFLCTDETIIKETAASIEATENVAITWTLYEGRVQAPNNAVKVQLKLETEGQVSGVWQWGMPELAVVWSVVQSSNYEEGTAGWALDENQAQFGSVNVMGSIGADVVDTRQLTLDGVDVGAEIFPAMAGGLLAVGSIGGASVPNSAAIGNTETVITRFNAGSVYGDRYYIVNLMFHTINAGMVAGDVFVARLRYTTDGTTPTTASAVMDGTPFRFGVDNASGSPSCFISVPYTPAADYDQLRIAFTLVRLVGSGTMSVRFDDSNYSMKMWVTDVGLQGNVGGTIAQISKSSGAADAEPKATYTRDWGAVWGRSYDWDGSTRSPDTNELRQGRYDDVHGNTKSLFGFDDADIRSKLSGATIKDVELKFRVQHATDPTGLDVEVSSHDYASKPGTWDPTRVNNARAERLGSKEGSTYTIGLPTAVGNEFKSGATKGLGFGPGLTTHKAYNGYMYGPGSGNSPRLYITYEK